MSLTGPHCSDISQCSAALWSCMGNCVGVFSLESLVLFCSGKFSSVVFPGAESSVLLFMECPQLSFVNLLCLSFLVVCFVRAKSLCAFSQMLGFLLSL